MPSARTMISHKPSTTAPTASGAAIRPTRDQSRLTAGSRDEGSLIRQYAPGGGQDAGFARQVLLFEAGQGHDRVPAGDPLNRREQRNQTSFGDSGGDLRADAAGQRRFMDDYAAPRLGDPG